MEGEEFDACPAAYVLTPMLESRGGEGPIRGFEERFRDHFAPWSISILPGHVQQRRRGKIIEGGWAIWYLFGEDERGEYLDYYASHRMTNDRHIRLREDGTDEHLPVVSTMRPASQVPEEDARPAAEHFEENRRVAKLLEEKGFGIEGDEPGGVQMDRYLALGEENS